MDDFEQVLNKHSGLIRGVVRRYYQSGISDWDDLYQEASVAFWKVWKRLGDDEQMPKRAWYEMRSALYNYRRKTSYVMKIPPKEFEKSRIELDKLYSYPILSEVNLDSLLGQSFDDSCEIAVSKDNVAKMLRYLPSRKRQVTFLCLLMDIPNVEVARILGVSDRTVGSLLWQSKNMLNNASSKAIYSV